MTNANTFIIYADGKGNVTLSPRHAKGNVMPLYDSSIDAELLAGSGVQNGIMTANVRCGSCQSWGTGGSMDFKASSGGWIHARSTGDAINSTNVEERIKIHSMYGAFTWSFTPAVGGASANPFQDATLSSSAAPQAKLHMKPIVLWCHGVFAATAFALFFPLGAILIRVSSHRSIMWVHAAIQMIAWTLFATAFGLGLYFALSHDILTMHAHPIIGIVLFSLMTIQPFTGWIHHKRFAKSGTRSVSSHAHIWVGRGAIMLGMINGGLGLMWARRFQKTYIIVYSVIAGVMGVAYLAAIVYGEVIRKKRRPSSSDSLEAPPVEEKSGTARNSWGSVGREARKSKGEDFN